MTWLRLFGQYWTARGMSMRVPYTCPSLFFLVLSLGAMTSVLSDIAPELYEHLPLAWQMLTIGGVAMLSISAQRRKLGEGGRPLIEAALRRGLFGVVMGLAVQIAAMSFGAHQVVIASIQCWLLYALFVAVEIIEVDPADVFDVGNPGAPVVAAFGPEVGLYKGKVIHKFIVDGDGGLHPFAGIVDHRHSDFQLMDGHILLAPGILYGPALGAGLEAI